MWLLFRAQQRVFAALGIVLSMHELLQVTSALLLSLVWGEARGYHSTPPEVIQEMLWAFGLYNPTKSLSTAVSP